MQIVSLVLTGILALYVFWRQRKYSMVQACVGGTGFFAVGCYLDIIFSLIVSGVGKNGSNLFLQCMGMLVSKGIMAAVLIVGMAVEQERGEAAAWRDADIGGGTAAAWRDADIRGGTAAAWRDADIRGRTAAAWRDADIGDDTAAAGLGWRYQDGLTVVVTLFFLLLAVLVRWGVIANSGLHGDVRLAGAWILTFFLAVLLIYDGSYYLYEKKQQEKRRQCQEEAGKRESHLYLENVEEQYQRTRELCHDLKNHITLLSLLLEEGKYVQMRDYLHIFAEDVDALTLPVKSGNLIVDALLAEKRSKARKNNIAFQLSLCNLTNIPLRPNEICGIFGNLLDNALEASSLVQENRFIAVECEEKEYCYYIRVRNAAVNCREPFQRRQSGPMFQGRQSVGRGAGNHSVEGSPSGDLQRSVSGEAARSSGDLRESCRSAKSDRRNQVGHGLGLRSVERIVHGCGGELALDRTDKQFTVAVKLPREVEGR